MKEKADRTDPLPGAAVINQNRWRCGIESREWCLDWHHETAANKPFQFEKCAEAISTFLGHSVAVCFRTADDTGSDAQQQTASRELDIHVGFSAQ